MPTSATRSTSRRHGARPRSSRVALRFENCSSGDGAYPPPLAWPCVQLFTAESEPSEFLQTKRTWRGPKWQWQEASHSTCASPASSAQGDRRRMFSNLHNYVLRALQPLEQYGSHDGRARRPRSTNRHPQPPRTVSSFPSFTSAASLLSFQQLRSLCDQLIVQAAVGFRRESAVALK